MRIPPIFAVVAALFLALFTGGPATAQERTGIERERAAAPVELNMSRIRKVFVGENGNVIARFGAGTRLQATMKGRLALQGCNCCTDECLIYDRNGVCVKKYRSCTWDFECSCRR